MQASRRTYRAELIITAENIGTAAFLRSPWAATRHALEQYRAPVLYSFMDAPQRAQDCSVIGVQPIPRHHGPATKSASAWISCTEAEYRAIVATGHEEGSPT